MPSKAEVARVAARARRAMDNPYNDGTRAFWTVQDAMFDKFMAQRERALEELHRLVAETGGPALDGSPESLGLLDTWLETPIAAGPGWDDGADWQAIGNMTAMPGALGPADMDMGQFERLESRVGFYYADVAISQLPGSKWVCWRAQEFNVHGTGDFLLDVGTFPTPADPLWAASGAIYTAWARVLDSPDPELRPDEERTLRAKFGYLVERRAGWALEGRALDFQVAPTGEEAGINRGPYKGSRLRVKIAQRRGY